VSQGFDQAKIMVRIPRKLIQGLVLTLVLGLSAVLMYGVWRAKTQSEAETFSAEELSKAEMKLKDMEYTEMRDGKRLWTLKASEAQFFQDRQQTLLTSVHLTLFLQDQDGQVVLQSREGMLYAGSKNIELWDSIQAVFPKGYQLSTHRAHYDHERRLIQSDTHIRLTGPDVDLEGARWEFDLVKSEGIVDGGVQASVVLRLPTDRPNN
jgi:LPS export ABC transporter protein LptC